MGQGWPMVSVSCAAHASWFTSPRGDVINPRNPWSSTICHSFHKASHHTGFNAVMWHSHHMLEISQYSGFNVTYQFTFGSERCVNLFSCRQFCPWNSQQSLDLHLFSLNGLHALHTHMTVMTGQTEAYISCSSVTVLNDWLISMIFKLKEKFLTQVTKDSMKF